LRLSKTKAFSDGVATVNKDILTLYNPTAGKFYSDTTIGLNNAIGSYIDYTIAHPDAVSGQLQIVPQPLP
jgi:hypothetical protein